MAAAPASPAYPDDNFGADSTLVVANTGGLTADAFIKFDLSGLAGAGVSAAVLQLQESGPAAGSPSNAISVFAAADSTWSEGTGTFASPTGNGITFNTAPAVAGAAGDTETEAQPGTYQFNVTSLVQSAVSAGQTRLTLVLETTSPATSGTVFQSRKAAAGQPCR